MKYIKINLFTINTIIHTFLHKQINCGHSFMTSTKRKDVKKIWAILQIVEDHFWGGRVSFFLSYAKFSNIF